MTSMRTDGEYSLRQMKSRFSLSDVVGNPASRRMRSSTLWQWKRLCSVSTYRIRCLPSGRCAR